MNNILDTHIAHLSLLIGTIYTDGGAEFARPFQSSIDKVRICHERALSYTLQRNGVVEGALGLPRDNTVALLRGVIEGSTDRLRAKAMNDAFDMSTRCITTFIDNAVPPTKYGMVVPRRSTVSCPSAPLAA